jgi:hypothetical protein
MTSRPHSSLFTGRFFARPAIAVIFVVAATTTSAQRPVQLNLGGGVSLPVAHFKDVANTGWNALAGIGVSSFMQAWGLRLDGAYDRFGAKSAGPTPAIVSGTFNFTYRIPMTNSPLSPYVITGLGAYHLSCSGTPSCDGFTRFGWNAGLGTKIAALHTKWFLETRLHAVNASGGNIRFVPISLGLTF